MESTSPKLKKLVGDLYRFSLKGSAPKLSDKPYAGAQPLMRPQPELFSEEECDRRTTVVLNALIERVNDATTDGGVGVQLMLGDIALNEESKSNWLDLLLTDRVSDTSNTNKKDMISLCLGDQISHTVPRTDLKYTSQNKDAFNAINCGGKNKMKMTICMGHPSYYICLATNSKYPEIWEELFDDNSLAVIASNNAVIVPIGNQIELVVGVDSHKIVAGIREYFIIADQRIRWSHDPGTKKEILHWLFPNMSTGAFDIMRTPLPKPLDAGKDFDNETKSCLERNFNHFDKYFEYMNNLKASRPGRTLLNYFDVGLTVSLVQAHIAASGNSLLTSNENWATLNEGSIGHTMSKMVQLTKVTAFRKEPAIYNFYIGDGACRLNGGLELLFDMIEKAHEKDDFKPILNLFVFHNGIWAIEDNLIGHHDEEHILHDHTFYSMLVQHPQATVCRTESDLSTKLADLTIKMDKYARSMHPNDELDVYKPAEWKGRHIELIVVESLNGIKLPPPIAGNIGGLKTSVEYKVFRETLEHFSRDTKEKIPIYGCSAFEYIQYLDLFIKEDSEVSRKYEYCCVKTDIQAAHQIGFDQPEGKAVLMINDAFGINSLGESLRLISQNTSKNKQILIFIWHPMLLTVMDLFQAHRAPFIWQNPGPHYVKYFFNNEKDILTWDLKGKDDAITINKFMDKGTKLLVMNMVPQHERDSIRIQSHIGVGGK